MYTEWNLALRTPGYFRQFGLSRHGKAHTFSLTLTRLIQTPVNTDTLACPLGVRINRVPLYRNKHFILWFTVLKYDEVGSAKTVL